MEKYFPSEKLVVTGNPVRKTIVLNPNRRPEAFKHFELEEGKPVLLVIGGSLGARTLNESVVGGLSKLGDHDVQLIWQCGGFYHDEMEDRSKGKGGKVILKDFFFKWTLLMPVRMWLSQEPGRYQSQN